MLLHKNSFKRIYFPGAVYYIVIKTHNNYPYFKEAIFCDSFIEDLNICKKLKAFKLYGFSIIYDHVNLLIAPGQIFNISQILKSLKRNVSRNINITSGFTGSFGASSADVTLVGDLTKSFSASQVGVPFVGDTSLCRLRMGDEGEYPLKRINELRARFVTVYNGTNPYPKFRWQKSFFDHFIRFHENHLVSEKDFENRYNYTVYNHLKHGLPENWPYTSLNYQELIDSAE
ncbi:MAG: transposase [Candidatus Parcubacteria bacterium]|nr:transposase [Candidatus Parcubacteria bacterium]